MTVNPIIEVVADRTKVSLGSSTVLHCTVARTNPEINTSTWIHEESGRVVRVLNGSTNTLTLQFSSEQPYFGTISCKATNFAGKSRKANVTIEQGCE